jgi:TBC1 domain family member 5
MLFTREFLMTEAMALWDGLFACDPSLDLAQWVCVAMLIRVRGHCK